jgi:hypothetical protein
MDNSFIKLYPSLQSALFDRMIDSQMYYSGGVCLHPKEKYLQITNSKVDISFGESYKVEVINCSDEVLATITDNFFLYSFQDHNGIYQIAFEIMPLELDFGFDKVYLKFTGLSNDVVFYSNDLLITEAIERRSFRIDYKNYDTENDLANYYQSIRVLGFYNSIEERQESTIYTEISGKIRRSRVIQNFEYEFKIEALDTKVYKNLAYALASDILYVNEERATVIDKLNSGDRQGKSNRFESGFTTTLNEDDTFVYENQIASNFEAIELLPLGTYSLATIPILGQVIFNYNIVGFDSLNLYNSDTNTLIQEITSFVISSNSIAFSMPVLSNGNYNFVLLQVENNFSEKIDVNWSFTIQDGDFLNTDFEANDFLIF